MPSPFLEVLCLLLRQELPALFGFLALPLEFGLALFLLGLLGGDGAPAKAEEPKPANVAQLRRKQ
jgi:hypothetical protein